MAKGGNRRQFLRTLAGAAAFSVTTDVSSFGRTRRLRMSAAMPDTGAHDRLQPEWYQRKIGQAQEQMKKRKLNALVLLNATNIIYTTGYFHLSTERPLAALIPESGDPSLFIPELESDQVKLWWVKDYEAYFDFPGSVNRVRWIFERVAKRGLGGGRIGMEEPTPGRMRQMKLGAPKATIVDAGDLIEKMRWIKDEDELRIMRRAMYFADFTVQAGREFVQRNGSVTEDQIQKATADAVAEKLSKELNDVVGVGVEPPFGGLVPFGKRSAFPHAVPSKDRIKPGDALILSLGAQVGGYNVECERSFSIGKPTDYAKRLFDAMLAAHDAGAENMKEGEVAEEVDKKSLDQIRKAGFEKFLKHRTGHGIGLEGHESPWIAEGDKTVLKGGMTFSCEPGVYDPDWGGFRHSDTVIVRKDKGEIMNHYPTRLEDMIIEI
ncbi:MAG TPA: Xaa-Pro peptidase family protein [Terriglobales bacterium]|nr:Xaa-Pro peptidase family protein [Terriglobales bacterium]